MTDTRRDAAVPAPVTQVTCADCGKALTAVRVALQRPGTERGRRCGPCSRKRPKAGARV